MHTKTQLMLAVIAALGLTASSAFATTDSTPAGWRSWQSQGVSSTASQVAKQGRNGQDDLINHPEENEILGSKGRGGHDDVLPEDLQPEIEAELLAASGRGKDGTKAEDNGVDPADACDDNGNDLACV